MPKFSGLLPMHTFFSFPFATSASGCEHSLLGSVVSPCSELESFRVVVRPPQHNLPTPPRIP